MASGTELICLNGFFLPLFVCLFDSFCIHNKFTLVFLFNIFVFEMFKLCIVYQKKN